MPPNLICLPVFEVQVQGSVKAAPLQAAIEASHVCL